MRQSPLFSHIARGETLYDRTDCASYKGISLKTFFLLAVATIIAAITAFYLPTILENNLPTFLIALMISSIVGFISVIVGRLSHRAAKYASFLYALCEGLFLGTLSCIAEFAVPGVSVIAVFSTLIIFAVMLTLFSTGILRVGNKYRRVCLALGIGVLALILFSSIMSIFIGNLIINNIGILIAIEAFLLIYGVITLALNFAEAQMVVQSGISKQAEWSVALGLMVSLVYIYVEIIRLILIISSNRN